MDVFSRSKAAGKPWQIFAAGTVMGPQKAINIDLLANYVSSPELAAKVKAYTDAVLANPASFFFRAAVAMDLTETPYNRDGFDGFAFERAKLINGFMRHANNPIVLGGDLHDSWAWTLYKGGKTAGKAAAVNLGCPGVTSPGWGALLSEFLAPLVGPLGGPENAYKLVADNFLGSHKGLVFANVHQKGFVAVKATKEEHIAEYILFDANTILSNYDAARSASQKITADFSCAASLKTKAGRRGSLVRQPSCSAIEFEQSRPSVWNLSVPIKFTEEDNILKDCGLNACVIEFDSGSKKGKSQKGMKSSNKGTKHQSKSKKSKGDKTQKSKSSKKRKG